MKVSSYTQGRVLQAVSLPVALNPKANPGNEVDRFDFSEPQSASAYRRSTFPGVSPTVAKGAEILTREETGVSPKGPLLRALGSLTTALLAASVAPVVYTAALAGNKVEGGLTNTVLTFLQDQCGILGLKK